MNPFTLPHDGLGLPLYDRIYRYAKEEIASGRWPSREKLPSRRKLAAHLGVSVNTVDAAYGQLVAEGYVESSQRRGYFVVEADALQPGVPEPGRVLEPAPPERPGVLDFSPSAVDTAAFPFAHWRKLARACLDESALLPSSPLGDPGLRDAVAGYLRASRGVRCGAEQVLVGAGTDHLLYVLGLMLPRKGVVAMENPVYNKAYHIFEGMGRKMLIAGIDDQGMPPPPEGIHVDAAYITPSHQFPLGISMPFGRRVQMLNRICAQDDGYIIEDDYDSEFRYEGRPIPALQSLDTAGRVIYLGTFSKSIAPSLRVSYMILPERLLRRYTSLQAHHACSVSLWEQRILAAFLRDGFDRHLRRMRKIYKQKRLALTEALRLLGGAIDVLGEQAGHHLLVRHRNGLNEKELCELALARGVRVYGISRYFLGAVDGAYRSTVLLGYGGLSVDEIRSGVEKLAEAWGGEATKTNIRCMHRSLENH